MLYSAWKLCRMTDTLSDERRSWNMSRIGSKNTKPELAVRKLIHASGIRYRLHAKDLPGNPDVVIRKYKIAIQIRGCFWHMHRGCSKSGIPKSNTIFWYEKLTANSHRDRENDDRLETMGYIVFIIWECEVVDESVTNQIIQEIQRIILKSRCADETSSNLGAPKGTMFRVLRDE